MTAPRPDNTGRHSSIIAITFALVMVLILILLGTTNAFGETEPAECYKIEFDSGMQSFTAPVDGTYTFKGGNVGESNNGRPHGGYLITVDLLEGETWTTPDKDISHVMVCTTTTTSTTTPASTTTTTTVILTTTTTTTSPTTTVPTTTTTVFPSTTTTTSPCQEDEPCWECETMGNLTCGPTTTVYTGTTLPCPCLTEIDALSYQVQDLTVEIQELRFDHSVMDAWHLAEPGHDDVAETDWRWLAVISAALLGILVGALVRPFWLMWGDGT
ncbi:hypothetical protein LCGC14_1728860 [marine sediment metagenome]|uniref:Uncharacterized protein n=1 Tax=marine sediment metagenome TaxID=412755 RepID=A0A0F9K9W7_9ZZZZ